MSSTGSTAVLSRSTVHSLCPTKVKLPSYDAQDLQPGIVHFGLGNFHRAHQARYIHDLFEQGLDHDWAIVGAGSLPMEIPHYQRMTGQDCLYTLVEQSPSHTHNLVVASIVDYIRPAEPVLTLEKLVNPAIRIVSLTITEGGYFLSAETGTFNATHPIIMEDVERLRHNQLPQTVFGLIVSALRIRQQQNVVPFTVLSCDNIPHNGDVTHNVVVGFASMIDSSLSQWIDQNVTFPNSMVDRITPATCDKGRSAIRDKLSLSDNVPVFSEHFRQWVLEDKFVAGRPQLEKVGVRIVDDVGPFERMKIRMLNGGHAALGYPAALLGHEFVDEAMKDADIVAFLRKVELEDIVPVVGEVPGVSLDDYLEVLVERFGNSNVKDTMKRLCYDGSNRQPKFIVGSIGDNLDECRVPNGLALVCALWCRYCYGEMEDGTVIEKNDPHWGSLYQAAREAKNNPKVWLEQKEVYGLLSHSSQFVKAFEHWMNLVWSQGVRNTLRTYVYGPSSPTSLVV